jgi:glutaredoxin
VDYRNVKRSAADLQEMITLAAGRRQVPVLVEDGEVTIGYGGT